MSLREEQCKKVCRILDDVLANRPTERDSLIVAVRKAFKALAEVGTDVHDKNVGELISRQAAIDALENDKEVIDQIIRMTSAYDEQLDNYVAQHNQVVYDIDVIKQLPPIQPEIMRCGDGCKFWDKLAGEPKGMCYILRQCTRDSFYCGNAMRREDGENNESN